MISCPSCGTANEAGRKFCGECGGRLSAVCPSCGTVNAPTAKFCGECATPLAGAAQPVASAPPIASGTLAPTLVGSPAPVAERRLVSILFADLVGFTPFAAERDAEDVRETLTRYFDLASQIITRYGGTVEKFIGDAVMAVWGAPVTREDDAELAVRAALELVDAVRGLGPTIQARAGVLTGEAAVTLGAINQGMVAGDIVNTAARLQSVARPGTVLVGEPTMRASSAAIAFQSAGDQELKGKATPVAAFRALRVVAEVGGKNRQGGLEAPFVGRDDEMRELKELVHGSARERRVRLVSVIGPAGIGKSRLAWEFLKYMDGLVDTTWWHQGRSPAFGQGISFWALGEMIRGRCKLLEGDDERTTRSKVSETLAQHVPDPDERAWLEPALLTLLGIGSGASSEQLFAAWRTFFERLAVSAPVVMVFEDLHWADSGTLDFIDHLLEWSRGLPIFVLTLARPDLLDRHPTWGAGKRSFVSIHLEPLPESAMRALLGGLVPGLPESAVRTIVARAEGMPLYAVETVRMLLAEGRLEQAGDAYRMTGDLSELAVPETLTALIASRLDALDPEDRTLIQDAAVLGQSFAIPALAAVSGSDPDDLEPRLRALVRRELLNVDADPRSPERGQYAFVQALIREVAYHTLARRDRKVRHLAAARYFDSLGSEELVGALAGHYLAAHENAAEGAESDALAAQARVALRAAADRAAALGSPAQAIAFLEGALKVTTDAADEALICERAARLSGYAASWTNGVAWAQRGGALHEANGDRAGMARAAATLAFLLINAKQMRQAIVMLDEAIAGFVDLEGTAEHLALEAQLARACALNDAPRRALEVVDRTLEVAEHLDEVALIADLLVTRGTALNNLGRYREGIGTLTAASDLARSEGLDGTLLRAYNNLVAVTSEYDPRAAARMTSSAIELGRRLGHAYLVASLTSALGGLALRTGEDWAGTDRRLAAMLADEPDPVQRFTIANALAGLRAARGEPVDDLLAEMRSRVDDRPDHSTLSILVDLQGNVAFASGRPGDARALLLESHRLSPYPASVVMAARASVLVADLAATRESLAIFDATGSHGPAFDAARATVAAGILAMEGREAEAVVAYRDVRRRWQQLGLPWDESIAALEMATVLDPSEPEVSDALDEAQTALTRMGARPMLAHLERVRDRRGPTPSALDRTTTPTHAAGLPSR